MPRKPTRVAVAAVLVALLLPAGAAAAPPSGKGKPETVPAERPVQAGKPGTAEGIVQSVAAHSVVLRQLDGSAISIPVGPGTLVFVDGRRATLRDVKPGFVATAVWRAKQAKRLVAFGVSRSATQVGVVESVSSDSVVVTESDGTIRTIRVTASTRVLVDGRLATLRAVEAGFTAVVVGPAPRGNRPARELRFLRPG